MRQMLEVPFEKIESNDLTVNAEDTATFNRLVTELEENGMLELPVLVTHGDGYKIISGHHRVRAWRYLGNSTVPSLVYEPADLKKVKTKEDEFNLVNNFNRVRGEFSPSLAVSVANKNNLDVTKLDIFKFAFPTVDLSQASKKASEEAERKKRLIELTNRVAAAISVDILDGVSSPIVVLVTEDSKIAVLIRLETLDTTAVRKNAREIIEKVRNALDENYEPFVP